MRKSYLAAALAAATLTLGMTACQQDPQPKHPTQEKPAPKPNPQPEPQPQPEGEFVEIPDAALLKQILALKPSPDTNGDGKLSKEEAAAIKELNFNQETKEFPKELVIKSLKGLEHFTSLEKLDLKNHSVSDTSPIEGLTKLKKLNLGENGISSISTKAMPMLEDLRLYGNPALTVLDLSANRMLEELYLQRTGLTTLDLTGLTKLEKALINESKLENLVCKDLPELERLDAVKNKLTKLAISNLPKLKELHANGNGMTEFTITGCPKLERLNLYANQLKEISLEQAELMFLFLFENKLETLDLSKLPKLFIAKLSSNPFSELSFAGNPIVRDVEVEACPKLEHLNLKNGGYNEEAEYLIVADNGALKKVTCDAGAEETHIKNLFKSNPSVTIVTE